jgi:hypothetical protein
MNYRNKCGSVHHLSANPMAVNEIGAFLATLHRMECAAPDSGGGAENAPKTDPMT